MKSLHYLRLAICLVAWQARKVNEKSVNQLLGVLEVFDKAVIPFILPVLLAFSYFVLG